MCSYEPLILHEDNFYRNRTLSKKKSNSSLFKKKEHTSRSKTCDLNNFKPHFDRSECFFYNM